MGTAVIIGGSGKVGSYLAPGLLADGYDVVVVSRTAGDPFVAQPGWADVRRVAMDRADPEFPDHIAGLGADVVVDMICFTKADMDALVAALAGSVGHYLVCGSVWIHGPGGQVPVEESEARDPTDEYGIQKNLMDAEIARLWADSGFPGTAVHPGHIVCPGDVPINPQGFKGLATFEALKRGDEVCLPNFGMETLHHVAAQDVAGVFRAAIAAGKPAFGEGFHAVSPRATTLRGYAIEAASWFGQEAELRFAPFDEWSRMVEPWQAAQTLEHITRSPSCSSAKAESVLGYRASVTSYEAVKDCLASFGLL